MFATKILADSINPAGDRITTVELQYPRAIHSEFMTHRTHSRNAASSRAIPVATMLQRVIDDPWIPLHWGLNQKGMQATHELTPDEQAEALRVWIQGRDSAVEYVRQLLNLGLHKQIANRMLEPWMWITVIATANERGWENFFRLRCHEAAEPHIRTVAYMTRERMTNARPLPLKWGEWHLPLFGFEGDEAITDPLEQVMLATARCARVSYLTHDGKRDTAKDMELHDTLAQSGHWSPFEHCAKASDTRHLGGNLGVGWHQYRKFFLNEFPPINP